MSIGLPRWHKIKSRAVFLPGLFPLNVRLFHPVVLHILKRVIFRHGEAKQKRHCNSCFSGSCHPLRSGRRRPYCQHSATIHCLLAVSVSFVAKVTEK